MKLNSTLAIICMFLAACTGSPSSEDTGGRELRPPRTGIKVGSLYYVREASTQSLNQPANLEDLCVFDLETAGVTLGMPERIADIDLFEKLDASGDLQGLELEFAEAGLDGGLNQYFSYKLTNAHKSSISLVEAQNIFDDQGNRERCSGWRSNIDAFDWAPYQILSVTTGDLVFERNADVDANAEVQAKLALLQPRVEAALKREFSRKYTGKGLVVNFLPLPR